MLLAKELNQLSFSERNDISEEIHGVSSRYAVDETAPELISRSLQELQIELDTNVPMVRKVAYERSQQIYNNNVQQEQEQAQAQAQQAQAQHQSSSSSHNNISDNTNTTSTPKNNAGYVNDAEFRLMFLRRDLFDVRKAALRLANFMELVYDLWGDVALTKKTWKSQAYLSPFELNAFRMGMIQCLQGRDRAGRRILLNVVDNSTLSLKYTMQNRVSFEVCKFELLYSFVAKGKERLCRL